MSASDHVLGHRQLGDLEPQLERAPCKGAIFPVGTFAANAVRLQLHALAYNLGPEPIKDWSAHNCDALRSNFGEIFPRSVVVEGIMSGQIPRPFASIALVATLLAEAFAQNPESVRPPGRRHETNLGRKPGEV